MKYINLKHFIVTWPVANNKRGSVSCPTILLLWSLVYVLNFLWLADTAAHFSTFASSVHFLHFIRVSSLARWWWCKANAAFAVLFATDLQLLIATMPFTCYYFVLGVNEKRERESARKRSAKCISIHSIIKERIETSVPLQ